MIRKARKEDIDTIMTIYATAREYMKNHNNPTQWGDKYPLRALIEKDVSQGISYLIERGGCIRAVFVLILGDDPTYSRIDKGAWLNNQPYATIHRIASDGESKGTFKEAIDYSLSIIDNIRIDTHEANTTMQHLIEKVGFKECGIIYVADGTPRKAYHLQDR